MKKKGNSLICSINFNFLDFLKLHKFSLQLIYHEDIFIRSSLSHVFSMCQHKENLILSERHADVIEISDGKKNENLEKRMGIN